MRKWVQNYTLFIIMFLLALCQAVSGFTLWLALPSGEGYQGGRGAGLDASTFLSWPRHNWIDLHDWTAVALLAMLIIHLILHWKWIVYMTKKSLSGKE